MARDRLRYFRIEARELLEGLGQGVLELEKGAQPPEQAARLLRFAHTLKGAARVVKELEIADLTHRLEDELAGCRDAGSPVPRGRIDGLLRLLDDIGARVAALASPAEGDDGGRAAPGTAEELFRAFRPDIHELEGLLNALTEAHAQLDPLKQLTGRVERASHLADLVVDHLASPSGREAMRPGDRAAAGRLRSLAAELRAAFGSLEHDFDWRLGQVDRAFRDARGAAERLRLVPARAIFTLLERTARDAAQMVGKRVVFEGRGGDVRLDAQLLGAVQAALLQLVRNAVAHGIEPPADRAAAGKPPDGKVTVDVARRGTSVVFACRDDGRGVDVEAVRQAARRKGHPIERTAAMGSEDALRLLLAGGLTTSGTVTDAAGRGIGLDVVRETAERLGGGVEARTETGAGTSIEIAVPFAMASLPALLVEAGGGTAILPLDAVRGSLRVAADAVGRTAQGPTIVHEGQSIALAAMDRALALAAPAARPPGPASAVVLEARGRRAAFTVDRIVGTASVVLSPLPELAPAAPAVAGVSLDEAGVPRLVLDPDVLVASADRAAAATAQPAARRPAVLVIDDSLTTRMLEQSILESAGYAVDLATSGEEALEKARATDYALFLVDVEMPGMDGFTFIERARAEPALRRTPSILVTSRSSREDQRRGLEAGAQAYIVKSEFDQRALLERIRTLVG